MNHWFLLPGGGLPVLIFENDEGPKMFGPHRKYNSFTHFPIKSDAKHNPDAFERVRDLFCRDPGPGKGASLEAEVKITQFRLGAFSEMYFPRRAGQRTPPNGFAWRAKS